MKHRIFIAINIPESIRANLLRQKNYFSDIPAQWTKQENIHITLVFIGYVSNEELEEIIRESNRVVSTYAQFDLDITRIHLGPPSGPPRMVWAEIEKQRELIELQRELEYALWENKNTGYRKRETRSFAPHLTLARFNPLDIRKLTPDVYPDYQIHERFTVSNIDIMKSTLTPSGAEYSLVKHLPILPQK